MLFNSFNFIFVFLPISISVFYFLLKFNNLKYCVLWLILCSLFFYGWWNLIYLILIISSVSFNYILSSHLIKKNKSFYLFFAIFINLLILFYYKYYNFFIDNLNNLTGKEIIIYNIILPLGISFFTFQQIAYLLDIYSGRIKKGSYLNYLLFVTFFPQLIAGPIVHYSKIIPQFLNIKFENLKDNFINGFIFFSLGLFKKVCIADKIGLYSDNLFDFSKYDISLNLVETWVGVIAFTLQVYFDFSGYSDMAIGLGLFFGIVLPLNFYSPFKSKNISIFWRNWHITLSNFIRDYIYTPISVHAFRFSINSNFGSINFFILSILLPIFFSYLLIGIWHGAGWNYILFGLLHALFIIINILWVNFFKYINLYDKIKDNTFYSLFSGMLTFICVVVAFVLFRAENLDVAANIYKSMFEINNFYMHNSVLTKLPSLRVYLINNNLIGELWIILIVKFTTLIYPILILLPPLFIALYMPNTSELMQNILPKNTYWLSNIKSSRINFSHKVTWAFFIGIIFSVSVLNLSQPSKFLYYNF